MSPLTLRTVPALLLALFAGAANAAAFQLLEQNASGLGNAYAGSAAVAENASTIFFNPAGMSQLAGIQVSAGVSGVGPSYRFRNGGSNGTGSDGGDAGSWAALPNAYLSWQLSPALHLGFGLSSPFGLGTEYEDGNWVGRFHARKSSLKTVNLNPSLAYRLGDTLALGFGLNYQTLEAELSSAAPGAAQFSRLKGDDSTWGWNAGLLYSPSPAMRIGLAYRSTMKYSLEGTASTAVSSTPVRADVRLPDSVVFSVWQQVSDRWEAMGDLSYTRWGTLQSLNVATRDGGLPVASEAFNYDNSWRFAWGAAYQATEALKLKFGIAYDRTPVHAADRTARVPDHDRTWFSLGGQWRPSKAATVDLGYSYLHVKDANIAQTRGASTLRGHYEADAHLVGLQVSLAF